MSDLSQIKYNAQWVIENIGPHSGLENFGYDPASVAYLDGFIDRQGESFRANEQSANKIVSFLGAFLGEAMIANYGGEWQQNENGISLALKRGNWVFVAQPFQKVHKRLMDGQEDNLYDYFSVFIPELLANPDALNKASDSVDTREKRSWWKWW